MLFKRMHLFRVRLKRNGWGKKNIEQEKGIEGFVGICCVPDICVSGTQKTRPIPQMAK